METKAQMVQHAGIMILRNKGIVILRNAVQTLLGSALHGFFNGFLPKVES